MDAIYISRVRSLDSNNYLLISDKNGIVPQGADELLNNVGFEYRQIGPDFVLANANIDYQIALAKSLLSEDTYAREVEILKQSGGERSLVHRLGRNSSFDFFFNTMKPSILADTNISSSRYVHVRRRIIAAADTFQMHGKLGRQTYVYLVKDGKKAVS